MSHNLTSIDNFKEKPEKRIQQLLMLSSKIELNTSIAARKYDFALFSVQYKIQSFYLVIDITDQGVR